MKARIDFYCKPAKKKADYDLEEIHILVDLPFVPGLGHFLKLTPNGDHYAVSDVFFDASASSDGLLVVGLKEPDGSIQTRPWKEMKAEGWQLNYPAGKS